MKKEKEEIELRSEEFQEVLGGVPPWILRWGITTVAIVMLILLIGSAIFKYPDVITATVTLTGTMPTASIVSRSSGKIQKLYVKDNQTVRKGDYLAVIENSAEIEDILYLKKFLHNNVIIADSLNSLPHKEMSLGNIQPVYSSYCSTLFQYIQFKSLGYYQDKIDLMKERIIRNEKYYNDMFRQRELIVKQLDISYSQYRRDSILHKNGLLSDEVLENTFAQYLQGQLSLESMHSTLENLQIQIGQMRELLLDTEYQYVDKKNTLETELKSLTTQLLTEIQTWEMNYVLIAPIPGKIAFTNYWIENQNIMSGEIAFNVVPPTSDILLGKAFLPTERSGKVKTGQKVNIRFSNFPDNEFGIVKGVVRKISLVSVKVESENHYVVEIKLFEGLQTTYKKELPFIPNMEGQADIITDDLSLLERFLLPIKKILTDNL